MENVSMWIIISNAVILGLFFTAGPMHKFLKDNIPTYGTPLDTTVTVAGCDRLFYYESEALGKETDLEKLTFKKVTDFRILVQDSSCKLKVFKYY
jgi:hypothetical protein